MSGRSTGCRTFAGVESPARVTLSLGSGGARGYAHIGVIEVLQEWGIEIVGVAGTSMGAVVGGLHAAGGLDDFTTWATSLRRYDVLRLLDASLTAPGAIRAEKIMARVRDLVGDVQIEQLPIPFTAVATDLLARKPVWFQHGALDMAIRASISIPGVFTPVVLNGRLLVDGGLVDPVPISPMASVRSDAIVAVDLGGKRAGHASSAPVEESADPRPIEEWAERFRRGASQLFDRELVRSLLSRSESIETTEPAATIEMIGDGTSADTSADTAVVAPAVAPFETLPVGLGKFDVMAQSIETMQALLTGFRLAGHPPDLVVTVPFDACGTLDFHRASEMIDLGRRLTTEALTGAGIEPVGTSSAPPRTQRSD